MNELVNQFVNTHNNRYLEVDGAYKYQCVDVAKGWQDKLGLKRTTGNAINWLKNCDKSQWDVHKAPELPTAGSLVVFGTSYGKVGHIALCVNVEGNRFNAFEQNNPIGSKCHMVNHSMDGVIGWMAPKGAMEDNRMEQQVRDMVSAVIGELQTHLLGGFNSSRSDKDVDRVMKEFKGNKYILSWIINDYLAEAGKKEHQ